MKRIVLSSLLIVLPLASHGAQLFSPLSNIETSGVSQHHWRGYFNWTSDYVYRGVSLSNSQPARQAAIDYRNDNGVFAGWWVSTMEFAPPAGPNTEHNVYLGYSQRWSDTWRSELSATYFDFRGGKVGPDNTFTQWQLATTYADAATLRLYYAENTYGLRFVSQAAEFDVPYAIDEHWAVGAMIGYWRLEHFVDDSYYYADVSLRYQWRYLNTSIHYHHATEVARDTYGDAAENGWLFMIAVGF